MDALQLYPHPDFPSAAVTGIRIDAGRRAGGWLALRYYVEGDLDGVEWPPFDNPDERVDGLWQHSCFEAFVGFADQPGYSELNFAALSWAAYRFDDYRAGVRNIEHLDRHGHWSPNIGEAEWHVRLPDLAAPHEWRLGVSAIIEAKNGSKSFWALKHPPGKPDFHHADCFAARIPAPAAP